jgi:hypothetical protein
MIYVSWYNTDKRDWENRSFEDWGEARRFAALEAPRPNIMAEGPVVYRVPKEEGGEVVV